MEEILVILLGGIAIFVDKQGLIRNRIMMIALMAGVGLTPVILLGCAVPPSDGAKPKADLIAQIDRVSEVQIQKTLQGNGCSGGAEIFQKLMVSDEFLDRQGTLCYVLRHDGMRNEACRPFLIGCEIENCRINPDYGCTVLRDQGLMEEYSALRAPAIGGRPRSTTYR